MASWSVCGLSSWSTSFHFLSAGRGKARGRDCTRFLTVRKPRASACLRPRSLQVVASLGEDGPKQGQQLWRKELRSSDELSELESFDDEIRQSSTMERDIARLAEKEKAEKILSQSYENDEGRAKTARAGAIKNMVDKVLVADFFFILFILAWLVAGLAEQIAVKSTNLIDSWLPLWPLVFQPALGVFMAGAIVSAMTRKE